MQQISNTVPTFGWDAIIPKVSLPAQGDTVNSDPFVIPRNSQTITLHIPSLVGAATIQLQALDPKGSDQLGTQVWRQVQVFNLGAGGMQPLTLIPSGIAATLPTAAIGSGVYRIVASQDQSSTPVKISITMSRLT